jgi:hypothetical protein
MEIKKEKINPSGSVNTEKVMEWIKSYLKVKPNNEKRINKSI